MLVKVVVSLVSLMLVLLPIIWLTRLLARFVERGGSVKRAVSATVIAVPFFSLYVAALGFLVYKYCCPGEAEAGGNVFLMYSAKWFLLALPAPLVAWLGMKFYRQGRSDPWMFFVGLGLALVWGIVWGRILVGSLLPYLLPS